ALTVTGEGCGSKASVLAFSPLTVEALPSFLGPHPAAAERLPSFGREPTGARRLPPKSGAWAAIPAAALNSTGGACAGKPDGARRADSVVLPPRNRLGSTNWGTHQRASSLGCVTVRFHHH